MFEDYLEDAYFFATEARSQGDERSKKRYYRAAVLYAASALEAFMNYLAETLETGSVLEPFELAYVRDLRFGLNQGRFEVLDSTEYHRLEDKLRILLSKFCPAFEVNKEPTWSHLAELKKLRDEIVHPKESDDTLTPEVYDATLSRGLKAVISIMDHICQGVFNRRLRQRLLDLSA